MGEFVGEYLHKIEVMIIDIKLIQRLFIHLKYLCIISFALNKEELFIIEKFFFIVILD
ncbi:TPA: hypothetical protein QCV53_001436 [Bacillus cereus]|nr:hypothetical protein [Bacillus cereus]